MDLLLSASGNQKRGVRKIYSDEYFGSCQTRIFYSIQIIKEKWVNLLMLTIP